MSDKEDNLKYWMSLENTLFEWAKLKIDDQLSEMLIWQAISMYVREKYQLEFLNDVFFARVSEEELQEHLLRMDLNLFREQIEISTGNVDYTYLTFERAEVRVNGRVWRVHKNDKDPFPSNPHAHEIQDCLKLDLSNGFIYKFKRKIGKVRTKELLEVRQALLNKGICLPTLAE